VTAAAASLAGCGSDRGGTPTAVDSDPVPSPARPSTPPATVPDHTAAETDTEETPTPTATPPRTSTPTPPDHYVYVGREELAAVAQKVRADEEPWTAAYEKQIRDADRALEMEPRSVVDDGAPDWEDPHRAGADEKRHDYDAAIDMTTAVRDTALAYWFTDRDVYARRAIDLLAHWCLDPETRMKPDADMANNGTFVELFVTIPKLWYGAALVRDHPYWTERSDRDLEAAFRAWVRQFVDSTPDPGYYQYNNHWAWRIATLAGAASYLDDDERLDRAFCMWRGECETRAYGKDKPRPWNQYRRDGDGTGYLQRELARNDGFSYHVYGVKALTTTAEVARHRGVDLYGYNAPTDPEEGSTLRKLFDFMKPYLESPSTWQWGKGSDGFDNFERDNAAALYELAYSRWADDAYLDLVESFDRPAYDFWIFGWPTLTHGNLCKLDVE
jgi:hypothetical protein